MRAALGRVISNYRGLVETCQQRAVELGISRLEIDRLGGLPDGYSGKLLGKDDAPKSKGNRGKRMWPVGLEAMIGALGLKILLIEDEAATARTLALRKPVTAANQRFGNECHRKPPVNSLAGVLSNIDSIGAVKPLPKPAKPEPVSRAHLRVVVQKRGCRIA